MGKAKTLECSREFSELNFKLADYIDEQGKKRPMYEVTCDGWIYLTMVFTGKKAAKAVAKYNGHEIDFSQDMVSLTQMWRACGSERHKQPSQWMRYDHADELLSELSKMAKTVKSQFWKTKRGRIGGGTFAHWQLGIAYAQFLDPRFQLFYGQLVRERFEEMSDPELSIMGHRFLELFYRLPKLPKYLTRPFFSGSQNSHNMPDSALF